MSDENIKMVIWKGDFPQISHQRIEIISFDFGADIFYHLRRGVDRMKNLIRSEKITYYALGEPSLPGSTF